MQALKNENERLNALVKYECIKTYQSKDALYMTASGQRIENKYGLRYDKCEGKEKGRVMVNSKKCPKFVKESGKLNAPATQVKKVIEPIKHPQAIFYVSYVFKINHRGKVVAHYVDIRNTNEVAKRRVWVPNVLVTNMKGPKKIWVPKIKT